MRAPILDRARAIVERTFGTTATVIRRSQVADSTGGFTNTYTAIATYRCSFSRYQITPVERESTVVTKVVAYWLFSFPIDADIRPTDRLQANGRSFEVVSAGDGSVAITLSVIAQEIT